MEVSMKAYERFLNYIKFDTVSDEESDTVPSTSSQMEFAKLLVAEMKNIGISNISLSENGYIYGEIPASKGFEDEDVIGFISHMDTAPSFNSKGINPKIISNYNGEDIILNENITMFVNEFTELKNYIGQSLIVTDGLTLLGADDKAGISEILTAAEELINDDINHGKIMIAFTPDEEIGRGADLFDVKRFNAKYAYTVDGGEIGELEFENFNAASLKVNIKGNNIHPGYAYNKMKNSMLIANEFISMLPNNERPEYTRDYEGFYHLCAIKGDEENTELKYIIRDHDFNKFEKKKEFVKNIEIFLNLKYGEKTVFTEIKDSYYNMKEKIEDSMYIIDRAKNAMLLNGVNPIIRPIRGGTDGSRLSFMGLPCPNISTGGHNFHSKFEYIPIESMDKMVYIIKDIAKATNR
jgi:tripeptide aminopeptidase